MVFLETAVKGERERTKVKRLINAIEELVRLADKEIYYRKDDFQLRFETDDSVYVIGTRDDGSVYLSVYFGSEIGFKFHFEKDGALLLEEGSIPALLEYSSIEQVMDIVDGSGEALLTLGTEAIEAGNYEFKRAEEVNKEFARIRSADRKRNKPPERH